MKKILLSLLLIGSSLFGDVGEVGSERVSFQLMIKVELIKDDNTRVTILDDTKPDGTKNFIELKTTENQTGLADELEAVRPGDGIYIGAKYTVTQFKHKLKIVDGLETYYTVDTEVALGESWGLSTDINDYGYTTTVVGGEGFSTTVIFPKVLTLESGSDASLIWVNQYLPNSIRYELDGAVSITETKWADEATKVTAFLPATPSKTIVFDVIYTKTGADNLTNTITALLDTDGDGDLIGAYQMRPSTNSALNGSFLTQGTKTDSAYSFRFQNGDDSRDGTDGDDYYDVTVTLNCTNSSYSDLIINEVQDDGAPATAKPSGQDGYSLTESGTVTCTDLTL